MSLRFIRSTIAFILAAIIVAALALQAIRKERRKREAFETPTPRPSPGEIYVPEKVMEVSKLFSGIHLNEEVDTEKGMTAQMEKDDQSSYTLNLQLKVRVPKPNTSLQDLQKLNENLPTALPWLETGLPKATVSPFYDDLYRSKVAALNKELPRLDTLISRQHFFDCETVLQLDSQTTRRHAILIQAAMEVDTDGSDGDRVSSVDTNSSTFQPMTSYKWAKKTDKENPLLSASQERLRKLTQELFPRGIPADQGRDLPESLINARYEVSQLKKNSFLVAAADPYIVLPYSLVNSPDYEPYSPKVGDYCVVIYDQTLYPAIVGDVGPSYKIGEASLRICKEINALSSANNRPISDLKVTYIVFPDSADKPDAPDLGKWHARCDALLNEMGGYKGELKAWEDLTKPKPTPTPTPTPSPSPSPSATPSPQTSPSASPGTSASPAVSPAPSATPAASPSSGTTSGS